MGDPVFLHFKDENAQDRYFYLENGLPGEDLVAKTIAFAGDQCIPIVSVSNLWAQDPPISTFGDLRNFLIEKSGSDVSHFNVYKDGNGLVAEIRGKHQGSGPYDGSLGGVSNDVMLSVHDDAIKNLDDAEPIASPCQVSRFSAEFKPQV